MAEKEIEVFIGCVENYFSKRSEEKVIIETPYLTENITKILFDYTGIINISGAYQGFIYFTADKSFLEKLLLTHTHQEINERLLKDVIGEVTNTLSGNARKSLGGQFVISVPSVVNDDQALSEHLNSSRSYVIPIKWHKETAAIVVSINKH